MKIVFVILSFLSARALADSKLEATVKDLTAKTILVHVGLTNKCPVPAELISMAGAKLELAFDNGLGGIDTKEFTLRNWKKISAKNCLLDCSCFALSKVYERYPANLQKKISNKSLTKKLSAMTDRNYERCLKPQKNFCDRPEIKAFIDSLKQE